MKIALSTSVVQRGKSGVAQHVLALTRALLPYTRQHDIHLLVLKEDLPLFDAVAGAMTLVPVPETFRPAVRNIFWHQVALPRWLRKRQIEVLHVPSYRRMLWRKPCGLVATIHDLASFQVADKYDPARMFYGRSIAPRLAHRQDEIIAISANTGRDIERFFKIPTPRVKIIHNGIDHERFHPGDFNLARGLVKKHWNLDRPFFLYISRLEHPAKNHVRLIEAFNQFRKATSLPWLLALGGSDWHGASVIHQAAAQSPYAEDIRFLGFVADSVLPDLYRAAEALVYPSLYEGFGLPPVEAMACGCPVLSSDRGSLGEVVGQAAGILDPESVTSILSGLLRMAGDEPWRAQLRECGLKNAARFDWSRNAEQTLAVYEKAGTLRVGWGVKASPRSLS